MGRGEVGGKNKGSRAATEDPLQGRGIEFACAERQKVVCLVSSWQENHVVPALIISKARAGVSGTGYFLLVFVIMFCYSSMLTKIQGCYFRVVLIFFSEYSCTRKTHFAPDCRRSRIIFSQPMAISPGVMFGVFAAESGRLRLIPGGSCFLSACFSCFILW